MMQEIDFYLVDAFSDRAFGGNAAAVCPLEAWLSDETLLKMAKQHNQSETAFFVRTDNGFELRWFTTQDEINLCGHATLAASHVIFEYLDYPHTEITFTTRFVGELTVQRSGDWLAPNFPAWSTEVVDTPPPVLFSALGINAANEVRVGRDYMVVLDSQRQVEALTPDITAMLPLGKMVCVTAPGDEYDFVSRFFCPGEGVPEDPVTGSAHSMLIPYWSEKLGKTQMSARQRRGSALRAERRPRADWRAGHAVYEGKNFPSTPGLRSTLTTGRRWLTLVQQRDKCLQLAGHRPASPHQPGGEPAPVFRQRPRRHLMMPRHALQHGAGHQRNACPGNHTGEHPVVGLHLMDPSRRYAVGMEPALQMTPVRTVGAKGIHVAAAHLRGF